jgi:N-acetylated-alpha-linked acidic dipeptidase
VGELAKAGWRPKRTIVYAAWDAEEPACSAPPSGPRPTPTSCARRRSPTSTPTATAADSSTPAAPTPWSAGQRGGPGGARPADRLTVAERGRAALILDGSPAERAAAAPRSASSPWARARTTPPSSSTWGSPRSTSASAARTTTASTTRSTTRSTTTSASWTRPSPTASAWPDRRPDRAAAGQRRRPPVRVHRPRRRSGRYVDEVKELADDLREGDRGDQPPAGRGGLRALAADPRRPEGAARARPGAPPQLRPAPERPDSLDRAPQPTPRRWRLRDGEWPAPPPSPGRPHPLPERARPHPPRGPPGARLVHPPPLRSRASTPATA